MAMRGLDQLFPFENPAGLLEGSINVALGNRICPSPWILENSWQPSSSKMIARSNPRRPYGLTALSLGTIGLADGR
jgi:hypothetical protein